MEQQQRRGMYRTASSTTSSSNENCVRRGECDEPLAFQQLVVPAVGSAVDIEMDIGDLFAPLPSPNTTTASAAGADFHFDFGRYAGARETPSNASAVTTPSVTAGHSSPETDSEHAVQSNQSSMIKSAFASIATQKQKAPAAKNKNTHSSFSTSDAIMDTNDAREAQPETEEDLLEERRKRNRESMRRVRLRKRDAKLNTQQSVDALEATLQQLMTQNQHAAIQLATHNDMALTSLTIVGKPSYPELLSETASLSYENKHLRDTIKTHQVFEASMMRMLDDERLQQKALSEEEALSDDAEILLRPLLSWFTPAALSELIALATTKIQENKALIESIVRRPNNALGWSDQRCVEGKMARYLLQKTFHHESVEGLARKTWEAIVDIEKLATVMRWAKGMKILHWLSDDAAIVTRELTIPNPLGSDFPTRFRFTLLVFRTRTADGGWCIGTINLNIYGTSVDECLQKDATYKNGLSAHTMYGWTFSPAKDLGDGCHVELAGLTGNGTHAYAHNVLMEMITVVLLWEHATVASIRLLKT
ncbi:hypothetical protein Gpo141_00006942 [Globisporangium polare]